MSSAEKPEGEKYLFTLTRGLIKAPNIGISLGTVFGIMVIYEVLARMAIPTFLSVFIIPYAILIILDAGILRILKQYFPLVRLSLLNEIIFIITFILYLIISIFFTKNLVVAFLLAFSMSTFFRYFFYKSFLNINEKKLSLLAMFYVFLLP